MSYKEISTQDFHAKLSQNPNLKFIDVRTPEEYQEEHAQGTKNVPLDTLDGMDASALKDQLNLNPSEPVYLICRSGARSARACEIFLNAGFTDVYNISGGTMDWLRNQLPSS